MTDDRIDTSTLEREIEPPRGLDRKIASALRKQGLLRPRPFASYLAVAAALVAIVVIALSRRTAAPQPGYMLLLYESPQFKGGARAEYGAWARSMRPFVAGGDELSQHDVVALAGSNTELPSSASRLAGYFLIAARDDSQAVKIARACPHLRHGGAVVLRKIVQ